MRCACCLCALLALLSAGTSPPYSRLSGVTRTRGHLTKAYFCSADSECAQRLYCKAPGHAHSQCSPCKRRARRCRRDQMCCPGNECRNNVCSRVSTLVLAEHTPELKIQVHSTAAQVKTTMKRNKLHKGELGAKCVRSADCGRGLCCARHLWKRVCKAEPQEGQVCSTPWHWKHTHKGHMLELFQLCSCSAGLECRMQGHTHSLTNTHTTHRADAAAVRLHTCQLR